MSLDMFSDYGSGGSSANSSSSWGSQEKVDWSPLQPQQRAVERPARKSTSFLDLVMGRCSLEDAMREFKLNGSDAPYCPEDEWPKKDNMAGIGPSGGYLRQTSWPAPEFTPSVRLPRPAPVAAPAPAPAAPAPPVAPVAAPELPSWLSFGSVEQGLDAGPSFPQGPSLSSLSAEQRRVLGSLPDAAVAALLRQLDLARAERRGRGLKMECRFCKNNGERETYYRSHWLKDARGRVACPVLRAHRCLRCGASGDQAHTDKYCPRASVDERMKSAAMMRSVRLASGRYRNRVPSGWNGENYVVFGETSPSAMQDNNIYNMYGGQAPLDPLWAALEQKLML